MKKYFFDTETVGFHGMIVLIQYAIDDGPVVIHNVWLNPVYETLELIEQLVENCVIGFNLTFDWFHICKLYTTLIQFEDKLALPIDNIALMADYEENGRDLDICLRPASCFDLMLHARKGPYQSTMDRKDIRIKRIPTALAPRLAKRLDDLIPLKPIYFARKSDPSVHFQVMDIEDADGDVIPELKDIVLKFAPSSGLKALAADIMQVDALTTLSEIGIDAQYFPDEVGYTPFAKAPFFEGNKVYRPGRDGVWYRRWPSMINHHIEYWEHRPEAKQYAHDDIIYTRMLYTHFGITEAQHDDDDSILACQVAAVRWRGLRIDIPEIIKLGDEAQEALDNTKLDYNSHDFCVKYITEKMSEEEKQILVVDGTITTKGPILEQVSKWKVTKECCVDAECPKCHGAGWIETDEDHPAGTRAREILTLRRKKKRKEICDKFVLAGRLHGDANIIGALSGRMSGAGGLNIQGIDHSKEVRRCFPLAWEGMDLTGGDFAGSQVAIAAQVYGDPQMQKNLVTKTICYDCNGTGQELNKKTKEPTGNICPDCKGTKEARMKIYAIFGQYLFPGMSYDDIMKTKGLGGDADKYDRSKKGFLAMIFGGEEFTLVSRVGISEEAAKDGYAKFLKDYPVWAQERKKYGEMFCSMRQPGGIGTKVVWADPKEFIESMFGFKRFFTLENTICKTLFELANKPPVEWKGIEGHIKRRDREQTFTGAIQSALYAGAFALQSANMRAAANHVIQSPEASMVKKLQALIWTTFQPAGIKPWQVMPMNIHDELMNPARREHVEAIHKLVDDFVKTMRQYVPLMDIEWEDSLKSWADK